MKKLILLAGLIAAFIFLPTVANAAREGELVVINHRLDQHGSPGGMDGGRDEYHEADV